MPAFDEEEIEAYLAAAGARSIPIARSGISVTLDWCATYLPTISREETITLLRQIELELPVLRDPLPPGTVLIPAAPGDPTRVFYVRTRAGGKTMPGQISLAHAALGLACRAAGHDDTSLGMPADVSIRTGAGSPIYLLPEAQVRLSRNPARGGSAWPFETPGKGTSKV